MCGSGALVVSQGKHSRGPTREGRSGDKIYLQHHIKNQKSIPPGFPISYLFIPPWKIRARNRAKIQRFRDILKLSPVEPAWPTPGPRCLLCDLSSHLGSSALFPAVICCYAAISRLLGGGCEGC